MNDIVQSPSEPLRETEKKWLQDVYNKEVSQLWRGFFGYLIVLVVFSLTPVGFVIWGIASIFIDPARHPWLLGDSPWDGWYYRLFIIAIISCGISVLYYINEILPFRRDILAGVKYRVPYYVIKKDYFPATGQYFVRLSGAQKQSEVSEDTYNNCEVGYTVYVEQARYSKYIFSDDEDYLSFRQIDKNVNPAYME